MAQKVAIVCDWLVGGGAERVVYQLHKMYPGAPIYTAFCNEQSARQFESADIRTSYMQKFPFSKVRKFLPLLRQRWFESLDLREFDLVISSSGAEAKAVRTRPDAVHISYCHTPTHYYWVRYEEYMANPGFGIFDPIARLGLKTLLRHGRKWDFNAAQHANVIVANSVAVQQRIKEFYGRESIVIHPPVETERFKVAGATERSGFVITGRQTPYKRIDIAVDACTKAGLPLTVIGNGPEHTKLRRRAGPSVEFLSDVSDAEIARYYHSAAAFIFPNEDDFGIAPVEAMAAGTPVIAFKAGGALDYVIEKKTGIFFEEQDPEKLATILKSFKPETFDNKTIAKHAEKFSVSNFQKHMREFIAAHTDKLH